MNDLEKQSMRADEGLLKRELETAGARLRGPGQRIFNCCLHDDRNPSGSIYNRDGAWHAKCHSCGFQGDVLDWRAKINKRTVAEEFQAMAPVRTAKVEPPPVIYPTLEAAAGCCENIQARYVYHNPDGSTHCVVVRYWPKGADRKRMMQFKPYLTGWVRKGPEAPHPLYNADAIEGADRVLVVEGEKCADAGMALGLVTVTSLGGSGKAAHVDWTPLAGKKVYLWADNDQPNKDHPVGAGQEHMDEVRKILATLRPEPTIYRVQHEALQLPEAGDIADWVEAQSIPDDAALRTELEAILAAAIPIGVGADLDKYVEDGIGGKRHPWMMPWTLLATASRALIPGTVTSICGDPGCGKSFAMLELFVALREFGVKAEIYELEDSREYHQMRILAQMTGVAGLARGEWLEQFPEETRAAKAMHRDKLAELGKAITIAPPGDCSDYSMIEDWMRRRCADGAQVLIIDPVTAIKPSLKPWIADHEFMMSAKTTAERWNAAIVLLVHPEKGHKGGGGLGQLAGGAAFSRLSHTVIWMDICDFDEDIHLRDSYGNTILDKPNRIFRIAKARNGMGRGMRVGLRFDGGTLRLQELGMEAAE